MVKPITYGRCGNFLFQAAATIAYALDHGLEYTLPTPEDKAKEDKHTGRYPVYLQHLVNPNFNPALPEVVIKEKGFTFQKLPYDSFVRDNYNIILDGYWQSEKYFLHHREEILKAFGFPWTPRDVLVSVHVRRGDYLRLPKKHPVVTPKWYRNAMAKFPYHKFIFFSDDIAWCKQTFGKDRDVHFSENTDEIQDLVDMSQCAHHICSASTFSWWGAWLNRSENKRIIIPKLWFVPGWGGLDTKDIIPSSWERL